MTIIMCQLFFQLFCTLLPFLPKPVKVQKRKTASYSVFYQAWNNLTTPHLNLLLFKLAKKEDRTVAGDSSGTRTSRSNLWRHLKWKKLFLSKTSSEFYKMHIAVGITTGSVFGYFLTPSCIHDSRAFPWKQMPKTFTRVLMDKAYWRQKIFSLHRKWYSACGSL